MIAGNVTTFAAGDTGGKSRDFETTNFEVTSTYEDGHVEIAFNFKGTRFYLEVSLSKLMLAALKRAEERGTR